jgi:tetratricopeptide (TPR) repeat protein
MKKIRIAALFTLLAGAGFVLAEEELPNLEERRAGVYGLIVDQGGEPVKGIPILLSQNMEKQVRPMKVKTNKKGMFVYPRVEFFQDGYRLGIESDEYYIREFQLRTRRGTGEIWQDDAGRLTPDTQDVLPVLKYRGANATVYLKLGRIADYAAAPPPQQQRGQQAAAAQPVKPQRELSIAEQADEALALGDVRAAADLLAKALEESPDDADLRWRRAEVLVDAGDTAGALREARAVLERQPERAGARLAMAGWMEGAGQLSSAIPLLERQRELTPDDTDVLKALVGAYEQAGREQDARSALERWAELAPGNPEALLGLADVATREGDFAKAEELYERLAQTDPDSADTMYVNVGIAIMNKRSLTTADRERAITAFGKGLEINPDYARAHFEMAMALLGVNRLGEARGHFARFVELAPDDPRAAQAQSIMEALPK